MSEHILYQLSGFVDDRSLPDEAKFFDGLDQPDDTSPDAMSEFYEEARDLVLEGYRLIPAFAVNRPDVAIVVLASNIEVASW